MDRLRNLDTAIALLLGERGERADVPASLLGKQRLMRALMNVRQPLPASLELLRAQDIELQAQCRDRGVVTPQGEGLLLWQGDITRLRVDAIVNAANAQMLGCWQPLHACIDNCIHSAAGVQLRQECNALMQAQGHDEPTGQAKVTWGYNLPARYVIHTVGPIVSGPAPTPAQQRQLASCYQSCLDEAEARGCQSMAFCCISTGVFRFPNQLAAEIAVSTVRNYRRQHLRTVVFNVFLDKDYAIYQQLLNQN